MGFSLDAVQNRYIELTGFQPLLQITGVPHRYAHANPGIVRSDGTHEGAGNHVARTRKQTDRHEPCYAINGAGELGSGPIELQHRSSRVNQQRLAGLREHHTVPLSLKQLCLQILLEQPDLPRHRRLNEVEELAGARNVAGIRNRHKGAQLLEVHQESCDEAQ